MKTKNKKAELQSKIDKLESLFQLLSHAATPSEKMQKLDRNEAVQATLQRNPRLKELVETLPLQQALALKIFLATGQGDLLFEGIEKDENNQKQLQSVVKTLLDLESVYDVIGGIVGYYLTVLRLIDQKHHCESANEKTYHFLHPPGLDLAKDSKEVRQSIRQNFEAMEKLAHIYPVGGAGDRLDLHDEHTKEALPAASLKFLGKTLLEGLIRDLQAQEYIYYKIYGKQVTTPIVLMTSHEKNNHDHILTIFENGKWFGRPKELCKFFIQPLVPMITLEGDWAVTQPLNLLLKPGGHGVIWKLAFDEGILDWLLAQGHPKALVRQINNPIASTDCGLYGFLGFGLKQNKKFGFASCPRFVNAAEGMVVLIEKEKQSGYEYCITNIEYTEFEHRGIKDVPAESGKPYSQFPTNTNILFVDIEKIKEAVQRCPIPGMIINMKSTFQLNGVEAAAGRLESTMQNIADYICDHADRPLESVQSASLSTYACYNEREKTIAVCKKSFSPGGSLLETPEGSFYQILKNYAELFTKFCHFEIPQLSSEKDYLEKGPNFLILLHPAVGPLYAVIAQKINKGKMAQGSELQLEVAEVDIKNLILDGSLLVHAEQPLGHYDTQGILQYGEKCGKCILHNVTIKNRGINREKTNKWWNNLIHREEALEIVLQGNGEFEAEGITFSGNHRIIVPDGYKVIAYQKNGKVEFKKEPIKKATWCWHYAFDSQDRLQITK